MEGKQEEQQKPVMEEERGESEEARAKQAREWETMAMLWLTAFPQAKAVSAAEVETWIDSNISSLPPDIHSMPRTELIDRLLSIQNHMRPAPAPTTTAAPAPPTPDSNQRVVAEGSLHENPYYQFQRTKQWQPVYTWLESLDTDEVVKSKEIADWLTENADIRDELSLRHSKYHLLHYIKKCHVKILKRRERKKGSQQLYKPSSPKVHRPVEVKKAAFPVPLPLSANPLKNIPRDSDLYVAKQNEAIQKYKILLELEKKLAPHFSKRPT